jgi:nucleotide-binding universal stress UspA family protein
MALEQGEACMTYKSIMVHLELNGDNKGVLGVAAELALRFNTRVIGVAGCQPTHVLANEGVFAGEVVARDRAEIERDLAAAEAEFHSALEGRARGLQWRSAITYALPADFLAEEARAADLIVTGKDLGFHLFDQSRRVHIAELVMRAGRPVLLVPEDVGALPLRNVFVGWKESREARRAVADAVPLLREAGRVTVLEIAPKARQAVARAHVEDVSSWLGAHGIDAVPQSLAQIGDEADHLCRELNERRCDLFVAGAYGHGRLNEWALGGITQDMLLDPDFCVLLSH